MPRFRTAAAATLLVVPVVAGGFLLQEPPVRANATLFDQVLSIVSRQYVDSVPTGAAYEKAARGLVKELNDPYSELLSPKESEDFSRGTNGRYGGTGMYIGEQQGAIIVDRVFPHTPAEEAGVQEGDRIVSIDGVSTQGMRLEQVSDRLRGEPGSQVAVTYGRPGVTEPIKLRFTRRVVRVPAVQFSAMFDGKIGYVPLQTFNENAADEVESAVGKLAQDGAKGLVLDMRGNPGGIVDQSLAVASLFLRDGQEIVSVRGRTGPNEIAKSTGRHLAAGIPLVVLVDAGSASASEIVAGALQDHDRALVLGTTTFGKGLVQSLYSLQGGYHLKITTGKWFTPAGRSIHRERKLINGKYVELHPDSLADSTTRPTFKSDGGRTVIGGGGIRPDVRVEDDTVTTHEADLFRSLAPKLQVVQRVMMDYALELKPRLTRDFTVPPAWNTELMKRLSAAGVVIDPKYDDIAGKLLTEDLARRVTRMAFGDAAEKTRALSDDHQLLKAIEMLRQSTTQSQLLARAPREH
jgi:carboxyl-terminal processing protease